MITQILKVSRFQEPVCCLHSTVDSISNLLTEARPVNTIHDLIEFIAKEIILLKQGKLVSYDTCPNLVSEIENKVVEVEIDREELKYYQDNYRVSNLYHNGEKIVVRLVTDNSPENHYSKIVKPTLEDLYLYVFEQGL